MQTEKVVEYIKLSCNYGSTAVSVRHFKNPVMGQPLLIPVHLLQTREVLTPSYHSRVPRVLQMSGKIGLLHGRNPRCDSL